MPKKYNIEGFEQFFNVLSEENFERLMIDFMLSAQVYMEVIKKAREKHPLETFGRENWEVSKYHFTWVDDGKHDMKSMTITNSKTGETTTKRF